jgi:hypothetical protein
MTQLLFAAPPPFVAVPIVNCPVGYGLDGATCIQCNAGEASPGGQEPCQPCRKGFFAPNLGFEKCVRCQCYAEGEGEGVLLQSSPCQTITCDPMTGAGCTTVAAPNETPCGFSGFCNSGVCSGELSHWIMLHAKPLHVHLPCSISQGTALRACLTESDSRPYLRQSCMCALWKHVYSRQH